MSTTDRTDAAARERLSALADGELDAAGVAATCDSWRGDAGLRASWHAYQLIGDVLRSDDLASVASHDADFLRGLRARMSSEPVVLAPARWPRRAADAGAGARAGASLMPSDRLSGRGWRVPSALVAGVALVVGIFGVARLVAPVDPSTGGVALALSAPGPDVVASVDANSGSIRQEANLASHQLIRDARLDRYLDAHKQFAGTSMLGVPSPFLRSATFDSSTR